MKIGSLLLVAEVELRQAHPLAGRHVDVVQEVVHLSRAVFSSRLGGPGVSILLARAVIRWWWRLVRLRDIGLSGQSCERLEKLAQKLDRHRGEKLRRRHNSRFFYLLRRKLELLSERTEFVVGQVDENWLRIRRTKVVAVKVCGKTWKRWSCCCFGFTHDSLSLSLSLPLSHPLTLLSTSKCLISHISSLSVHLLSNKAVASFLLFQV